MEKTSTEVRDFVSESYVLLDRLEPRLVAALSDGGPSRPFNELHFTMRALRLTAGSRGYQKLESLAHTGEMILSQLDRDEIHPQPRILGFLLNLVEELHKEIAGIQAYGMENPFRPALTSPQVRHLPLNPLPWLQKTLVFRTPDDGRMAIPFDNVMRLEAFPEPAAGETGPDGTPGRWMPLVDINKMLAERRLVFRRPPVRRAPGQNRQRIVYVTPGGEVGLVVDEVLDVLKAKLEVQRPAVRAGVLGSMELQDRITELLDIPTVLAASVLRFAPAETAPLPEHKIAS